MAATFHSCVNYLGKDYVAHTAAQQLAEFDLPESVRARCVAAFTDPALERDGARQRLYLLAAIGNRKVEWPRLVYWKALFDKLGGQHPYMWTHKGLYPVERRRAHLPATAARLNLQDALPPGARELKPAKERRVSAPIRLEERHHTALLGLLQHYVQYVCFAERDRRQIANLGAEPALTLSRDPVEHKIEQLWLDGVILEPRMWRAEPPFFPGHRATLRPRFAQGNGRTQASKSAKRNVWVISL